jgi:RNA polymerase sigma-70 factor (ECF subfamily)
VTERPDAELIALVLAGRAEHFAPLVERYQHVLYRHAVGMVGDGDAAADLVQDAFVKAYTRLDTCNEPERFAAWVFRIVRNRCMDHLKNRRQHTVELKDDTATAPPGDHPGEELDRAEASRAVETALARLPEAQREAFLLKHVEGLSYEEMAPRLDASVSALKMRVMRAREALQEILSDYA